MMPNSLPLLSYRPAEGFYTSEVTQANDWPLRTFLPVGYEPNYPYPLLVFLHGHGSSDDQVLRLAPRLSRRNYISIAPRGPHILTPRDDGRRTYSWGPEGNDDPLVEEYIFRAIEQTCRSLHIHSERIYLVGFREGAAVAYRLGLQYPNRFAGLIALNGNLPRHGAPRLRLPDVRGLRLLIGHGIANAIVPMSMARQDYRLFYTAGLDVCFRSYTTTHKIHAEMLRDVDRWIQDRIYEDLDTLPE
jgi:phospholipase/carboxylesterase